MEPKGSQGATEMHPKIDAQKKVAHRSPRGCIPHTDLESFWSQNQLKMRSNIYAKNDTEKVRNIMRKCSKNYAKTGSKIHEKSIKNNQKIIKKMCKNKFKDAFKMSLKWSLTIFLIHFF